MVSGRQGDPPGYRARRGSIANEAGLRTLGDDLERHDSEGPTANEERLRALGDQIKRSQPANGQRPPGPDRLQRARGRRKRWSARRKVITALASLVALLVLVVAAGYAYLRYQWSQVKTVNCTSCVPAANGAPFNVLLIGSDSQAGSSAQGGRSFGPASPANGQRADTIKILHVDPRTGTARLLSFSYDTYVQMSGLPANSPISGAQKISAAYDSGPNSLIKTIDNSFGIPVSHFVAVNFSGVINTVQTLGGINLHFNYPVRDWNAGAGKTESGLNIPQTGCITLNGTQALALSRSRYYQYYANGQWSSDPTADIGRITRQNAVIEAIVRKAKSTYNPFTLNSFIGGVAHNLVVDRGMTLGDMYGLAEHYHAFSASTLQAYTLPTVPEQTPGGSDVLVVQEPQAQQTIQAFLGSAPSTPVTPPVDQYGNPISVPSPVTTTTPSSGSSSSSGTVAPTAPPSAKAVVEPYDPTPC